MLRQHYDGGQKAQIFLEYALVISAIVLVMFGMNSLIKRGAQGMIKVVADQVGNQEASDQQFNSGYLKSSYRTTRPTTTKIKTEFLGDTTYTYGDVTQATSDTVINMGFTEEN